jgi:large subunit ribosomal protein L17
MRHGVAGYRLGRNKDQRNALRRILINQLFEHERIRTTRAKAQAIRGDAERLITLARRSADGSDTQKMNARRLAASKMANADMVRKLFDDIAPRYANRPGGYTRMLRMGLRVGDAAEIVLLELVED